PRLSRGNASLPDLSRRSQAPSHAERDRDCRGDRSASNACLIREVTSACGFRVHLTRFRYEASPPTPSLRERWPSVSDEIPRSDCRSRRFHRDPAWPGVQAEGERRVRATVVGLPLPARGTQVGEAPGWWVCDSG